MNEIKVLNHGLVRLVDHMGSDLSIVRSARVYAQAMLDLIEPIVPVAVAALKKHVLAEL